MCEDAYARRRAIVSREEATTAKRQSNTNHYGRAHGSGGGEGVNIERTREMEKRLAKFAVLPSFKYNIIFERRVVVVVVVVAYSPPTVLAQQRTTFRRSSNRQYIIYKRKYIYTRVAAVGRWRAVMPNNTHDTHMLAPGLFPVPAATDRNGVVERNPSAFAPRVRVLRANDKID